MSTLVAGVLCSLVLAVVANPLDFEEISQRIINGQPAYQNQFTYHATIVGRTLTSQETLCGGALISQSHVLTAAHCVVGNNYRYFDVGLGSNNRSRSVINFEVDPNSYNTRIIHPNYNANTYINDLALLRLPINVTGTHQFVSIIRLPARSQENNMFVNSQAYITGFGRTNDHGLPTQELRYAHVRIIPQNECANTFGSNVANSNTLCTVGANFNAQGPCPNDNGAPLVLQENSGNTLIGINSFISTSGCAAGHPAGFARLGPHLQWLSTNSGAPLRRR